MQRGRTDLARESLEILRSFDGEPSGRLRLEAVIALREGDRGKAIALLQQYLRLRPGDEEAQRILQQVAP
jgi:hypothetical protein